MKPKPRTIYLSLSVTTSQEAKNVLNWIIDLKVGGIDVCSRYGDFEETREHLKGLIK